MQENPACIFRSTDHLQPEALVEQAELWCLHRCKATQEKLATRIQSADQGRRQFMQGPFQNIGNDQIKVLELVPDIASVEITKQKKERLLMLPRMQRDNPPTQLIRSIDGDYLKGRLLSMDEQQLQVEIRLESKALQRDRIARIIWLHADELDPNAKRPTTDQGIEGTRIQVLTDNPQESTLSKSTTGETPTKKVSASSPNRLTFVAQQVEAATISGRSELLGTCRADLTKVDRILIENAIEEDAATLAFHQWKLRSAADPVAARDAAHGDDWHDGQRQDHGAAPIARWDRGAGRSGIGL